VFVINVLSFWLIYVRINVGETYKTKSIILLNGGLFLLRAQTCAFP